MDHLKFEGNNAHPAQFLTVIGLAARQLQVLLRNCEEMSVSPLLASLQGGVAERSIKDREASADREAGVVFR
jgi:hypothetical protein